jgi:predicted phosphoribosyltransferase
MSALTTRCTDPKILLALCRASTHVATEVADDIAQDLVL